MPQFTNKKIILLLVSVILLVALIGFSAREREDATLPEKLVKDSVGFAQELIAIPTNYIIGVFTDLDSLLNTYEENQTLKSRLVDFANLQAQVSDLENENKSLRELVDKEESLRDFEPLHATVIARNPDQWEEKIILNKGSKHGVEKNMAVMTAEGLIGKITVVTSYTSEVELLNTNNSNYRVSAYVQSAAGDNYGLIEEYDTDKNELLIKRLPPDSEIQPGEMVVTSGLGGIFPKGIPIGEVVEAVADEYGLTKTARVKPFADFGVLDHVLIAKRDVTMIDGLDGSATGEDLTNGPDPATEEEGE